MHVYLAMARLAMDSSSSRLSRGSRYGINDGHDWCRHRTDIERVGLVVRHCKGIKPRRQWLLRWVSVQWTRLRYSSACQLAFVYTVSEIGGPIWKSTLALSILLLIFSLGKFPPDNAYQYRRYPLPLLFRLYRSPLHIPAILHVTTPPIMLLLPLARGPQPVRR
jgi:hypothetical protein